MSDDSGLWLLAAGPAGATALYWALYRYYRNTDKSHAFEHETTIEAKPVTGADRHSGRGAPPCVTGSGPDAVASSVESPPSTR